VEYHMIHTYNIRDIRMRRLFAQGGLRVLTILCDPQEWILCAAVVRGGTQRGEYIGAVGGVAGRLVPLDCAQEVQFGAEPERGGRKAATHITSPLVVAT
jgi:hypothetical protein